MTDKMKRSLDFVVKYYHQGAFKPDSRFIVPVASFRRRKITAAIFIGVALTAAAVTSYIVYHRNETVTEENIPAEIQETPLAIRPAIEESEKDKIQKIEFEDASLYEVVKEIEKVYGVKVAGLNDPTPRLTLSYQGTAQDLVATINDLLSTNLTIEE